MEKTIEKISSNWSMIVGIAFATVTGILWYANKNAHDELQDKTSTAIVSSVTALDTRVTALEHAKTDSDTRWAVLQVQMTAIQTDLTDIKTQLKKDK